MILKIVIVLLVLIGAVLVFGASRPDAFRVQRTAHIRASPGKIAPFIEDFHRWGTWSPWESLDPAMKRTYSGAPRGVGAVHEWEGNRNVGAGRMQITEVAPTRITIALDFLRPFAAHNVATFTLVPSGEGTQVTWAMDGRHAYVAKVVGLFVNMDRMVGSYFETGLARLRTATEAS
jgi:polyketide cyclase/dehydrase/lipid transport protein